MTNQYFGGIPTRPDVELLLAKIEVVAGTSVAYETVSKLVRVAVSSSRFRTITHSWRQRLFREKNIQVSMDGGHFHFLSADQALSRSVEAVHYIGRAAGRLHVRTAAINNHELTGEKRDQHMLMTRETRAILDSVRNSAKQIAGPKAVGTPLKLASSNGGK